jgi:CheY-like chemotaxis protein
VLTEFAGKALVVDDNFFNRDLCALALNHVGYSVTEAENGAQALEILKNATFDLLILDLAMPVISGLEFLRLLSTRAGRPLNVIVMTANPHMVTDDVYLQVDFVMHKPIDVREFARLAQRLLQRPNANDSPQAADAQNKGISDSDRTRP